MKRLQFIWLVALLCFGTSVFAQYGIKHPQLAEISGGYGSGISTLKNVDAGTWSGFHFRQAKFGISVYKSDITLSGATMDTSGTGKSVIIDYIAPIKSLKMGNRTGGGTGGWSLQPAIGGYAQFYNLAGNKTTTLGVAPELQMHLPYMMAAFRVNTGYNLTSVNSGLARNTKGLNFFPQLSLQFDALKAYHQAKTIKAGTASGSRTRYEIISETENTITYREHTTTWAQDWFSTTMSPFWAVSARAGAGNNGNHNVPGYNVGLGLSGRSYLWLFDTYASYGKFAAAGFYDVESDQKPTDLTPYRGSVNGVGLNLNLGFDAWFALKQLLLPRAHANIERNGNGNDFTPLNSIYLGMGLNYIVPGKVDFVDEAAASGAIEEYFASHPDVTRNAKNDPSNAKAGIGMNFFMQMEVGSIGVVFNGTLQSKMGSNANLGVIYHFPVGKKKL